MADAEPTCYPVGVETKLLGIHYIAVFLAHASNICGKLHRAKTSECFPQKSMEEQWYSRSEKTGVGMPGCFHLEVQPWGTSIIHGFWERDRFKQWKGLIFGAQTILKLSLSHRSFSMMIFCLSPFMNITLCSSNVGPDKPRWQLLYQNTLPWDHAKFKPIHSELAAIEPYFKFLMVECDAWEVEGEGGSSSYMGRQK